MLSLFSGIGGIDLAAQWAGIETVAFVEYDPFCQLILKLRYPGVPVYGDIRQVTGKQLKQDGITRIDIIAGGFPCQGNSTAGKRKGKADERYLWPEMARIVREVESTWMVAENVRGILSVGGGELFGDVIRDVANMGYSPGWGCWGANAVGAPHKRERVFILGNSKLHGWTASTIEGSSAASVFNYKEREDGSSQFAGASIPGELPGEYYRWPTPRANDGEKRGNIGNDPRNGLPAAVLWPTPQARDYKTGDNPGCGRQQRKEQQGWTQNLNDVVMSNLAKGQLNPDWVECLMNFPIGWTNPDCENPLPWPGWPAGRNQEQFSYEPPRVISGMKHRPKRLKALGNSVVPLQAVPIFAAIAEIERMSA